MKLSPLRAPSFVLAGAALAIAACSAEPTDRSDDALGEQTSASRSFCGNSRCDHGETCSTCASDCGACPDAGGSDASSGTNPCGSTAAPPAHYQHVVVFSLENRT